MIFYVSHVVKNSVNLIYYEILNKILQYVKLLKLSFVKFYFKKKSFIILIYNLNIVKEFCNKT